MHRNSLTRRRQFAREANEGGGGGNADSGQQQPPAPTVVVEPAAPQWDGKVESLPEAAQKMIRDLRNENADRRTKLTAAEQAQQDAIRALAKAAGIQLPDDKPDPQVLTEQLTNSQQQARQAQLELAVYRAANAAGADPVRLLDSNSFIASVREVDPTDTPALTAAISKAVADNTWLKAGRVPGASSTDHPGGSGEPHDPATNARPGVDRMRAAYAANTP